MTTTLPDPGTALPAPTPRLLGTPGALALAALSAAAGVVHLALAPSHSSSSTLEGIAFALAGWFQIGLAVALLLRPVRSVLWVAVAGNAVLVAVWAVSRTIGLPVGAHAGTAEAVDVVDLTTVAAEVLLLALVGLVLAGRLPSFATAGSGTWAFAGSVVASAVVVSTLLVASPTLAEHGHHGGAATDVDLAAAHDHGAGAHADPDDHAAGAGHADGTDHADHAGHDTDAAPVAERCDRHLNVDAYYATATAAGMPDGVPPDGHQHDHGAGEATGASGGEHDHDGAQAWIPITDQATCDRLTGELDQARSVALRYPTVADAEAAGYRKTTRYIPGIAAHYVHIGYATDGVFDIERPEMLLYDGDQPTSAVVGLSYATTGASTPDPAAEGFTGPNDGYHNHANLCFVDGVVAGGAGSDAACAARGGTRNPLAGRVWMQHTWVVPGCESPYGVFSGKNPRLDAAVGAASTQPGSAGCTAAPPL